MLWTRFGLILMLALVSARPKPELSLEDIEKELEQLTAQENDASETKTKTSNQADTDKDTRTDVRELTEKAKHVPKEKLKALEKSVTETEQKKDETDKTEAETDKTADTSADSAAPVKPIKPGTPNRDTTDADLEKDALSSRGLPKLNFKYTAAYRRLVETLNPRLPSLPKLQTKTKTSNQADTDKDTRTDVRELTEKAKHVPKEKLKALEKSVTETEQKKDETDKTEAETDKTADKTPNRDTTDAGLEKDALSSRGLPKLSFKDTAAYRRLMETVNPRLPSLPKLRADYKYDDHSPLPRRDFPSFPKRPHFPEAPIRRTYDGYYRKDYDYAPRDSSLNRGGFLPNSDPVEALRGLSSAEMTRAERMALSRGTWLPNNKPVDVPPRLPPPAKPVADVRTYNDVRQKMNDKETEDLIHGKSGLTDAEKRKRFLMDLLAEKLKAKVSEAQKRGLKIPSKIMDFLWNYEVRRGMDTSQSDKIHLSH